MDLADYLSDTCPSAILIGTADERKSYFPAIVGIDYNAERVVYSRDKLVECFVSSDGMTEEEAVEWVEYNIDRALPYWGEHAPIIMDDLETEMIDEE